MMTQVLVVDDVPAMAEQYAYDLKRVGGYHTIVAAGGDEALDLLAREPIDCVVLDLEMPGIDGFEVLRRLQQRGIDTPVIVYTGTGSYDRCVQAVRLGAYGFVDKAEPIERVVQEIENAVSRGRLVKEVRTLRSRFDGETPLIGDSAPMRALRDAIARVAPIPSSVLILGESGTGKELVARELIDEDLARSRRSSPSTARRCPSSLSRASCSATSAARSPAPIACAGARSRTPAPERCSSTRSASCRCRPRPSCFACSRNGR